ncbi:protein NO VEIN domain-containing protein [Roseibium sp. LAB1]
MSSDDWSDTENDAVVASYFAMLSDELAGRSYVKATHNRLVQEQIGRTRGSVEFKYCNVSAAAKGFGLPIIKGYQPRFNFQMALAEAISRWLARQPEWETGLHNPLSSEMDEAPTLFVGVVPTLRNTPPPEETEKLQAVARRFDVAGRDERNRKLGRAGEEVVFHRERAQLKELGLNDLARRVRWTSQEDGDGAGYDILSFTPDGRERLIEVKTTNGWERTPFHISRNELEVANARRDDWRLFRLYEFARGPKAFEIRPPLEAHVALTATSFQASFG